MAKSPAKNAVSAQEERGGPARAAIAPPLSLSEIIGQSSAIKILSGAIGSGRLHHAWIFHGPPGVGKFTAARAFGAKLLDPGSGPASALAKSGTHPDLHLVTKELARLSREANVRTQKQITIAVEVLRQYLIEPAALSRTIESASPAAKVFIVDEADLLNPTGQNALLKTLEEPPAGTVVILVTSAEHDLLPTIRSRCQRVAFHHLDEKSMRKWLDRSGLEVPAREQEWMLTYAAGSPGAFEAAVRFGLYAWHTRLEPMLALIDKGQYAPELGATLTKLIDERATEAVKVNPEASKEAANRLWSGRVLSFLAARFDASLKKARSPSQIGVSLHALDLFANAERQIDANVRFADVMDNLAAQLALPAPASV